jgi:hypothetical protein
MSWCDKLASTPAVGLRFEPLAASSNSLLDALSPLLSGMFEGEKPKFSLEVTDPMSLSFITDDGFKYGVDASRIHVSFNHRLQARAVSAGPPIMEMLSKPQPYTELLPTVVDRLIEATMLLPRIEKRPLTRVGVVALTMVDEKDVPPGIVRLLEYLARPWEALRGMEASVTALLREDSHSRDHCIHMIKSPKAVDDLLTLQFDWQREFVSGHTISRNSLNEIIGSSVDKALSYFEELAEGSRFDERIIADIVSPAGT